MVGMIVSYGPIFVSTVSACFNAARRLKVGTKLAPSSEPKLIDSC